jgi:hypothetical protein
MVATQVEGGYGRDIRKIIVTVRPYCMRVVLAVEPRGSSLRHSLDATVLVRVTKGLDSSNAYDNHFAPS